MDPQTLPTSWNPHGEEGHVWTTRHVVLGYNRGLECNVGWRTAGSGRRSGEGQSEPASRCVDISE